MDGNLKIILEQCRHAVDARQNGRAGLRDGGGSGNEGCPRCSTCAGTNNIERQIGQESFIGSPPLLNIKVLTGFSNCCLPSDRRKRLVKAPFRAITWVERYA